MEMPQIKLLLRLALRDLRRHARHCLAAALSIMVGYVATVCFQGYIADLTTRFEREFRGRQMLGSLIIEKERGATSERRLSPDDQAFVERYLAERTAEVEQHVRFLRVAGTIQSGDASGLFVGVGHDVARGRRMRGREGDWNAVAGDILRREEGEQLLLGQGLGSALGCEGVGGGARPRLQCQHPNVQLSSTTIAGRLNALDANVLGLVDASFKEIDGRFVEMPLGLAQRLLDTNDVTMYTVQLRQPERATDWALSLRDAARAAGRSLWAEPWREHAAGDLWRRTMSLLSLFRSFILSVVISVVALSVLNAIFKLVSERRRETATLRSIGFRRRQIVSLFLLEAALLGTFSVACGALAAWAIARYLASVEILYNAGMLAQPIPLRILLTPGICGVSGALLIAVAMVAAWFPARRAARVSPATIFSQAQ